MTISLMLPLVGKTQADLKRLDKGTGSLSFTRATAATRLNPDTNLIETVASGDLREDGRSYKNQVTHSEAFDNAAWDTASLSSVVANAITSPNGKMTGCKIIEGTGGVARVQCLASVMIAGAQMTNSVYLKKGSGRDWAYVRLFDGATVKYAWFNISAGAKGSIDSGATSAIVSVGNGWYRCSITWTGAASSGPACVFGMANADGSYSYTGDGASYIYAWGAQLEQGSSAKRYVKSGSSPAYAPLGILIEGQRTNVLFGSSAMGSNTYWNFVLGAILTENAATAPDGTNTAAKFEHNNSGQPAYYQQKTGFGDGLPVAISFYIKKITATGTFILANTPGPGSAYIDLSKIGNGWERITKDHPAYTSNTDFTTGTGAGAGFYLHTFSDAYTSFYMWGAQTEVNATFSSSYIPTTSAAVTRNADQVTFVTTGNVSEDDFTVRFDYTRGYLFTTSDPTVCPISLGAYAGVSYAGLGGYSFGALGVIASFPNIWDLAGAFAHAIDAGVLNKLAIRLAADKKTFNLSYDGSLDATSLVAANAKSATWNGSIASIGGNAGNGAVPPYQIMHIKNIVFFNRALTDAEMQAITTAA